MIYLVLDAFIEKTKSKYRMFLLVEILLLVATIVFLVLSYIIHLVFATGVCISMAAFFVILIAQDTRKRKNVQQRFISYDKSLNELADILRSFSFPNGNNTNENWYSSERIKYLIKMCDSLICKNVEDKNKSSVFLKPAIIAVVGFGAGVIAEKASLEINLAIGFIALMVIIFIYCFCEIGEIFNNIFFKSNSSEEIMRLKSALMDLLLRDFPESANH